jgi:hypothetical protein
MANASAETIQFFRSASTESATVPSQRTTHGSAHPAELPLASWDADDVPNQSYWTAYDHYMVEREARAMRRVYVWALLAKAWFALRSRVRA